MSTSTVRLYCARPVQSDIDSPTRTNTSTVLKNYYCINVADINIKGSWKWAPRRPGAGAGDADGGKGVFGATPSLQYVNCPFHIVLYAPYDVTLRTPTGASTNTYSPPWGVCMIDT